jgi:hypothetical protein
MALTRPLPTMHQFGWQPTPRTVCARPRRRPVPNVTLQDTVQPPAGSADPSVGRRSREVAWIDGEPPRRPTEPALEG